MSNDLIREARELCDKATPGPWEVKFHNEDFGQGYGETTFFVDMGGTLLKIGIADSAETYAKHNALNAFIARSRTLIPELCDALEKAGERGTGCEHCRGWDKRCGASFCPMCGRELEDKPCR